MGLGPCQRILVNVRGFYCAEHDHDHRTNEKDEQQRDAEAAKRDEPFPISLPPIASRRWGNCWLHLRHGDVCTSNAKSLATSSLLFALDGSGCREAGCAP